MALNALRRRPARAASGLAFIGLALFAWSFLYALCWLSADPAWQSRWTLLSYIGVVTVPVAVLVFALQYTRRERFVSPAVLALLAIEPVLTLVLIATDRYHGWFLAGHEVGTAILEGGPWFWVNSFYCVTLVLFATLLLARNLRHAQPVYRRQGIAVLLAVLVPVVFVALGLGGLSPWPGLDLTPVMFTFSGIVLTWALFRFGLAELVPVARDQLIDSMSEGVVVLDASGLVLDVNPAALRLTGLDRGCVGRPAGEVFASWPEALTALQDGGEAIVESPGTPPRCVEASASPVHTRDDEAAATLVTLRDVTERRRIAAAEREQRALAEALRSSAEALSSSLAIDDVLDTILDRIATVVACDAAAIVTCDGPDGALTVRRAHGYAERGWPDAIEETPDPGEEPLWAQLRETRLPLVIPDVGLEPAWVRTPENAWIRACLATTLVARGDLIGFLIVHSATPCAYRRQDGDTLAALGAQAAVALENARMHAQLEELATTDPLTGALNRRGFTRVAGREVELARRTGASVALLAIDVDHFKPVNDEHGHAVGDAVLRCVADNCRARLRGTDVVARSGGDELVALLIGAGLETARAVADEIRAAVAHDRVCVGPPEVLAVSVSIGVAAREGAAVDLDELFAAADRALYAAKRAGRDRVCVEPTAEERPDLRIARGEAAGPASGTTPTR